MSYRLPPLNALRAFESSARHLSFKQAANELNVTAGAISQHVKSLENILGVKLFRRMHQSLELTEAGLAYLPALRNAFIIISESTQRIATKRPLEVLSIGVQAPFATKWLFPRLPKFLKEHPQIDLRLGSSIELDQLNEGTVDAVIRYGSGQFPAVFNLLIKAERLDPVCSPRLLSSGAPLREPQDLTHHILLHDEFREGWPTWCQAREVRGLDVTRGLSFADDHLALKAAIDGHGVALGDSLLVEQDIRAGRLVRPFGEGPVQQSGYYFICGDGSATCAKIKTFLQFIAAELSAPEERHATPQGGEPRGSTPLVTRRSGREHMADIGDLPAE